MEKDYPQAPLLSILPTAQELVPKLVDKLWQYVKKEAEWTRRAKEWLVHNRSRDLEDDLDDLRLYANAVYKLKYNYDFQPSDKPKLFLSSEDVHLRTL